LDLLTSDMSIEDSLDSPSSISPRSFPPSLATKSCFSYCNELNSYFVDNANCVQTLNTLTNILSNYNDEIDFEINAKLNSIEGLVFLSNICVNFSIFVWSENANQCRFEFRRTSGDSIAAAKFWRQLKGLYEQQMNGQNEEQIFDFISLNLDTMHLENNEYMKQKLDKSELDKLTLSLIENDLFVIDELIFLYEQIEKNESICFDVLRHNEFMKQLINESMQNADICVVRIVLLILEKLASIKGNGLVNMTEIELFYNINLMLEHKRGLIKKRTIRLLEKLCVESEWNIDDNLRCAMIENVKMCETECNEDVLKQITAKLMMQ